MANKGQTKPNSTAKKTSQAKQSSWKAAFQRFNSILGQFAGLPMESLYGAFGRAMNYWNNLPSVQNSRVKALSPLPCDYTKQELNEFLVNPQSSEYPLQQVSEGLRWTNYSFNKTVRSYADMLQFHSLILPQHATADEIKSDEFKREYRLVEKVVKSLAPKQTGRKLATQAGYQGKVFYVPRYSVDKSHNKCNYLFMQQLPTGRDWAKIIGLNNISDWTVSFNLMYFMQPGTDYRQFGDLFEPFMTDFNKWVTKEERKAFKGKFVYASRNNAEFESEVKAWQQNGRWFYYVSLPIDRVWTFEIDSSTAITVSPFAGLMQTYAQQADYEAAQLSLIMNPLIKIFTGEIPYTKADSATEEDGFRLSVEMRAVFEAFWNQMMAANQTSGTAFYTAPVENIRSHDYPEAAGANDISKKFLEYGMAKSGIQALVPITDRPTEEAVKASEKLEPQFAQNIYRCFEKMLNYILNEQLNLTYSWRVQIFGDIYSDEQVRANCLKLIDKGSTYAYLILCALDDISLTEMVSMTHLVDASGLLDKLSVPPTAFTQTTRSQPKSDTGGAPTKTEQEKQEDSTIESGDVE